MVNNIKKIFNIEGKKILITGSTGYFGRHFSKTFLDVGANVILMGRSDNLLIKDYNKIYGKGSAVEYKVDFYDDENLNYVLETIVKENEIDVLINNAYDLSEKTGFNTVRGTLENSTFDHWESSYISGIYWAALTTQYIGKRFQQRGSGNIINISSMYGVVSPHPDLYEGRTLFNPPTYCVAKSGIIALTKYTASFWGKHGIRCNAIAPGPFPNNVSDDTFIDRLKGRTLLNRVGYPDDLSGILIYLASDASSFMTGQVIQVDGGWTVT